MLISARSHLIAGVAAVAVAGVTTTVAPLPVTAPTLPFPAATAAAVTLTALDTPLQQLLKTLNFGQRYLLGATFSDQGADNWWDAGFTQPGGDLLNSQLKTQPELGKYLAVGILPQQINQAQPILRQLETNISDYATNVISGLIDAGIALNAGVWGFPPALLEAAQLVLDGQFGPAFTVLTNAIIAPIAAAGSALLGTGAYVLDRVVTRIAAVVSAIPQIVSTYVAWAVGGTALLAEKTASIAGEWIDDLSQGDFGAAWNTAVQGLLGPTGLPGLALNLSIGAGVQTGPIDSETDIAQNFVPSARTAVQGTAWTVATALATEPQPEPAAAGRAAVVEQTAATAQPDAAAAQPDAAAAQPDAADVRDTAAAGGPDSVAQATPATESSADAAPAADSTAPTAKAPRAKRAATRAAAAR